MGTRTTRLLGRYIARLRWEVAYDEAVQWRDWQTCEQLLDERPEPLPWLIEKFIYFATGGWLR